MVDFKANNGIEHFINYLQALVGEHVFEIFGKVPAYKINTRLRGIKYILKIKE